LKKVCENLLFENLASGQFTLSTLGSADKFSKEHFFPGLKYSEQKTIEEKTMENVLEK